MTDLDKAKAHLLDLMQRAGLDAAAIAKDVNRLDAESVQRLIDQYSSPRYVW